MVTSTNQPTDQPGEYRAICLFRKLENRKKAEICKKLSIIDLKKMAKIWIQIFVLSTGVHLYVVCILPTSHYNLHLCHHGFPCNKLLTWNHCNRSAEKEEMTQMMSKKSFAKDSPLATGRPGRKIICSEKIMPLLSIQAFGKIIQLH